MEIVYSFLVVAAFVAMIIGLINPSLIMRWSKKPTRLKVFAWWFLVNFVLLLLLSLSPLPEPTSQELVNSAKRNIEKENYSSALYDLRKIDQTDSLYKEALTLISKVDSLLNLQTKNQEREVEKERLFADSMKQVLKKRVETEKLKFDVDYDEFEDITWLYSKQRPNFSNTKAFCTYIGVKNDYAWRRLLVRYSGDNWLFLKSIIIKTDNSTYTLDASNAKRDNYTDVWEWIDIPVKEGEDFMLYDIIHSKQTKIRFNGSQYHYDWTLPSNVIQGLKEIDDYYYLMDSLQKIDR